MQWFEKYKESCTLFYLNYRRQVIASCASILGVLALILHFQMAPNAESYLAAEKAVASWKKAHTNESYLAMRKALQKVPDLEKKYASAIAQTLLSKKEIVSALEFTKQVFKNTEGDAPFHAAYGKISLLIEQGSYRDALEKAISLREFMRKECNLQSPVGSLPASGSVLFAYNLLRIACLQKELQNRSGEKAAWEDLEHFLASQTGIADALLHGFKDQGLNLSEYIADRKKDL